MTYNNARVISEEEMAEIHKKKHMERYTYDFLEHAFVRCNRCGKEMKYKLELPRHCEFFHLEEDGKLHANYEVNECYCCDCILDIQRGEDDGKT